MRDAHTIRRPQRLPLGLAAKIYIDGDVAAAVDVDMAVPHSVDPAGEPVHPGDIEHFRHSGIFDAIQCSVVGAKSHGVDEVFRSRRSVDTAIDGCTAVIQSGQEAPEKLATAFDNRGVAYRLRGEYDRALHDYEQAIKLNPSNANAYNNRGIIFRIKGEYGRAIADYDEAIWLKKGDFPAAYYNRALAYADKGEYELLPRFGPMEVRSVARQDNHAAGRVAFTLAPSNWSPRPI